MRDIRPDLCARLSEALQAMDALDAERISLESEIATIDKMIEYEDERWADKASAVKAAGYTVDDHAEDSVKILPYEPAPPAPEEGAPEAEDDPVARIDGAPPREEAWLPPSEREAVWRTLAAKLAADPEGRLSGGEIAASAGVGYDKTRKILAAMVEDETLSRTGHARGVRYRLLRWPEGTAPARDLKVPEDTLPPEPPARRPRRDMSGRPKRRFESHFPADPENVHGLADDHPALGEARTLFPTAVVEAMAAPRLLVSGANHRKLGDLVTKGPWAGMPIYALVLEERATCPTSCHHWSTCYGNSMPFARRHRHGPDLEAGLAQEMEAFAKEHPAGFVVRLHILGDFYSAYYVDFWATLMMTIPPLRVFGYSAWPRDSEIGARVAALNERYPARWAIRFSAPDSHPGGATTLWRKPEAAVVPEGIVCPAQTGATECCGTCGLCWAPAAKDKTIVFVAHGQTKEKRGEDAMDNSLAREPWPAEIAPPEPPPLAANLPDGSLPDHRKFDKPLDRRCACGQMFKSISPADAICSMCIADAAAAAGRLTRCPPTGKGHALPHAESTGAWKKAKRSGPKSSGRDPGLPQGIRS